MAEASRGGSSGDATSTLSLDLEIEGVSVQWPDIYDPAAVPGPSAPPASDEIGTQVAEAVPPPYDADNFNQLPPAYETLGEEDQWMSDATLTLQPFLGSIRLNRLTLEEGITYTQVTHVLVEESAILYA